jgi:SAM-dependent methyltransferase
MNGWLQILAIGAAGALLLLFAYNFFTVLVLPFTGALFVATTRVRIRAILEAVPMVRGQLPVDLGCGDARMLKEVGRRYGVRCLGYELNPLAYFKAQLVCCGQGEVEIRLRNFWQADLRGVDVVFCYLFPDVPRKLAPKLTRELKPGSVLISSNFPVPGLTAERILQPDAARHSDPIFIYRPQPIEAENRKARG